MEVAQAVALCGGSYVAREKLGGGSGKGSAQRELPNQEHDTSSTGQGAQGARDTAQDTALPRDWQRPGEPRISKTFLPLGAQAVQVSCAGQNILIVACSPGASRPLKTESSINYCGR